MLTPAKRLVEQWPLGLVFATLLACLPLVNWLALAFAVLVLLRHGRASSHLIFVVTAFMLYFSNAGYTFAMLGQDWQVLFVMAVPLWVMTMVLRQTRHMSFALECGVLLLMAVIVLGFLFKGPPDLAAWLDMFRCRLQTTGMTEADMLAFATGITFEQAVTAVMLGWPLMFMMMQVATLLIGRAWQAKLYYPGGFQRDFHGLRLHKSVALVMALLMLASGLVDGPAASTVMQLSVLAALLLAVTGLGFVHWFAAYKKLSKLWLGALYGLMLVAFFVVVLVLALIGLLDSSLNLRQRLTALPRK